MIRAAVLAVALLLAACAGVPAPATADLAALRTQIYVQIGEERAKLDPEAHALAIDPDLSAAAQAHSEAMAKKRAFDKGGAEANLAIQQLAANPQFSAYVAENSAMEYFAPQAPFDADSLARVFVQLWMNSAEHKANIAFAAFDRTGIGVAITGDRIYAAQLFAAKLPVQTP